ncbi:MAG: helix-turn-helix transcriptional regulator [Pseudomonadota bacterium]
MNTQLHYPEPNSIRAARKAIGLTQKKAAHLIYMSKRAWIKYESGERRLHPQHWESWLYKAGLIQHMPRLAQEKQSGAEKLAENYLALRVRLTQAFDE